MAMGSTHQLGECLAPHYVEGRWFLGCIVAHTVTPVLCLSWPFQTQKEENLARSTQACKPELSLSGSNPPLLLPSTPK